MKPRASMPITQSTVVAPDSSRPAAASASTTSVNAVWSASTGVMSLKRTPGAGKSGTSTTSRASVSATLMRGGSLLAPLGARLPGGLLPSRGAARGDGTRRLGHRPPAVGRDRAGWRRRRGGDLVVLVEFLVQRDGRF